MNKPRLRIAVLIVISAGLAAAGRVDVVAQGVPRLDYTVGIADIARHLFRIRIEASNLQGRTIDISMAAWAPGWYTIRPYASNVIRLQALSGGRRLKMSPVDKQTWRIETEGNRSLAIEYDYFADNLNVNGADLTEKHGYFLGTSLFFYVPGHTTDSPSKLRFELPPGWRVATGLKKDGAAPMSYLAGNFENLADCPAVMGDFDEFVTTAMGKPIHIVVDPKGQVGAEASEKLREYVSRVIEAEGRIFGGLPYDEYWVLFLTGRLRGGGALEHENSTNIMLQSMPADPRFVVGVTAHEHFHAWNVKRIRPAGLIPYDYSREQYTRELWFAEGVTSYYGDLCARRAGLTTVEDYLRGLANGIRSLQNSEARKWVSLADSSFITWLNYGGLGGGFTNFTVNYYGKGELVGLLMDLEIRGATGNRKSLDDVMRHLFENHYRRGRGYTNEDVEKAASEISGRSFREFFAKYVAGTDELDYDASLRHAGLRLLDGRIVDLADVTDGQRALRRAWLGE